MGWYIVGLDGDKIKNQMISHYKQAWRRKKIAANYIQWGCDEVWEIPLLKYTQKVCEKTPSEFIAWIKSHGQKIGQIERKN